MSENTSLETGKAIRPTIDLDEVKLLAERLYGISVLELTEQDSYDDRSFKLTEDSNVKNPLITTHSAEGYLLNIINTKDTQNLSVIEAQNEIMNYLNSRSVTCPKPIRNVYGHLYSVESIGGKSHAVRLLAYVPGEVLKSVPKSEALMYQLGEFVANLDNKLQNFSHSGLDSREHIRMLTKVPELEKFKSVIKDCENEELAEEVIEEYKYAIASRLDELEKGVIHGDISDINVVVGVKPGASKCDYRITGIIDFSDIQHSYYVFELAIAMTSAILMTGDPATGGLVLAGYTVNRRLPDDEYRLLKTLISSRLVQTLILDAYQKEQDKITEKPSSEKVNGWDLLKKIRKTKPGDHETDPTDWKTIAKDYLTRS